jgi:hypothetical protein
VRRLLLATLVITSCGGPAWRQAVQANTSAAYVAYLGQHPDSAKAGVAWKRGEELAWSEARAAGTAAAYGSYVSSFPQGPHVDEARATAERLEFEAAIADGSTATLAAYVARHPTGAYAAESSAALERAYVAEARSVGTEAAWGKVLQRYPEGAYAEEARRERDRIAWNTATDAGTLQAYLRYLDDYPVGAHADEATAFVAATHVGMLQPVVVLARSYQPQSAHGGVLAKWQKEIERGMLAELRSDFEIRPTIALLSVDPDSMRGRDAVHSEPGVGVLVVEIEERVGRPFEPAGAATDLLATVELIVPPTASPVVSRKIEASTPERVTGEHVSSLYTSAVREMAASLHTVIPEIAAFRETR